MIRDLALDPRHYESMKNRRRIVRIRIQFIRRIEIICISDDGRR
ncbi:MAG: hypothetical protein K0Q73_5947 [Paenibacillus sp.]|jgi:hypothetical protein|nr:hypothetical protein [Paenibacillus sp.]